MGWQKDVVTLGKFQSGGLQEFVISAFARLPLWKPRVDRAQLMTALRRLLFLTALLCMSSVTTSCFDFGYNRSRPPGGESPPVRIAFATFMWGADSMGTVLAAWLAGRQGIWCGWGGRIRIAMYLAGRNFIVWIAFGMAHWTGVSLRHWNE